MNTKKINLIFDKFYPDMGGVQIYMKEAYSEMVNLGWDVSIHCINTNLNKFNHLPEKEIICGMKVNRYKFFKYKFLPFSLNFSFFEESVISLQEFCIFPHYLIYIITLFLKITGLKKYKLVLNSHGLFGNDISRYPGISRKIKWYIDHTIGVLLVNLTVDQIYVISNPEKNSLISAGIKSSIMHDIYYGLDKDAHKNIENESSSLVKDQVSKITPYLLQVGRIDRYKNYEAVIKILPNIPVDIKYIIAGPENDKIYKEELVNLISELKLNDRVNFIGSISGVDKFYLMKKALAYIQLAITEGFGMVVLEAKSQGTIGIVTKNTGMENIIKNNINGYTLDWDDKNLIVEKINYIYNNQFSDEINNLKNNNISETKDMTWEKAAKHIENLTLKN